MAVSEAIVLGCGRSGEVDSFVGRLALWGEASLDEPFQIALRRSSLLEGKGMSNLDEEVFDLASARGL